MSEKRFLLDKVEKGNAILSVRITDSVTDDNYFIMTKDFYEDDIDEIVDCLNEQQATISRLEEENEQLRQIATKTEEEKEEYADLYNEYRKENEQLRQQLQKKQEEEQLYANEILELREANKEFLQFKNLGGDY